MAPPSEPTQLFEIARCPAR